MHTIRVIPHQYLVMPSGEKHSKFSATASTPGAKLETGGYTWEVTQPDGSVTEGLYRVPAKDYQEALDTAHKYCDATGATLS